MTRKVLFSQEDCLRTGYDMNINGRVIILKPSSLPDGCSKAEHQLYYCTGGNGSNAGPIDRSVFTISLLSGEQVRWNRGDILGVAKPEVLSDHARLQLSQIRPENALKQKNNELQYIGYCFLSDGRYTSSVGLCSLKEVEGYIGMQKDYQYRIMICDRDDFCVFEIQEGKILHPTKEVPDIFFQNQV